MADDEEKAESGKGGIKKIVLVAISLMILIGCGVAYYFFVLNGSSSVAEGDQIVEESMEPESSETLYLQLTDSFTIQLRDSDRMMQLKLALRTPYGQSMIDEMSAHEIGIRAALLERLASVESATASSESFRSLIEPNLRDAANAILEEQDLYPGIDLVLFTEFLMQ